MSTRKAIVSRGKAPSTTSVLRRRVRGRAPETPGMEGKVVRMRNGEDFTLTLLRGCPPTINKFRHGKYLHVSDVLGKCMRKMALSEKFKQAMPSTTLMDALGLTFAQGTAMHDYVKEKMAQGHPDKMYGKWSCVCGKTITEPMVLKDVPARPCIHCEGAISKYHEMELFDDELMVVGSPDISMYLKDSATYYVIEIKSINSEAWKEITRPMPDHVLQVVFYWYLYNKLGYSLSSQVSILYANKGFLFKSPYKEFIVHAQDEVHRLEPYLEEVQALQDFRSGGEVPARTMCATSMCKEAKECHMAQVCFQHD